MKKAFTMLEFLIVLVVIAILAVAIIPDMKSNKLREAAVQVVSHIKYTQHLAMVDDKFDINNNQWYKTRWQIIFANYTHENPLVENNVAYSIFSDKATFSGKPDISEIAKDTSNLNTILSGGHSNLNDINRNALNSRLSLSDTYGIMSYKLSGGCGGSRISFDNMGRPIKGDLSSSIKSYQSTKIIKNKCIIDLCTTNNCNDASISEKISMAIEPETGYAHIL
jgi:prepilin-type N-terminal cleavage/methylation domain-containing protein